MKMAANASDTDSDAILAFYLFKRRRRRKIIYRVIYVQSTSQKRHIYGKYHHLVKELHIHPHKFHRVKPGPSSTKTKELIDFTRNSSCDHRLKIRSRGNPATFHTSQFPAPFVVAFGRNGFMQIAYTQSNANAAFEFVVAFAFVVMLCINRPLSAGFDCILYSSSWTLKLHPCTLTYIEIHTFLFPRKKYVKFCVNTAVYIRRWKTVTLFRRIYCSVCMPHAMLPAIYNSFAPSFEPRRAKLGKTFAG